MVQYKFISIKIQVDLSPSDLPEIISWVEAGQTVVRPDPPPVVGWSSLQYSDQGVHIKTDLEHHH